MFAIKESLYPLSSKKKAPSLISWLCFNCSQSSHYDVGYFGEKVAIALFEDAGYKAYKPKDFHCGDIIAVCKNTGEIFSVEVKTSRFAEGSNKWQFSLNKPKHTKLSSAAFLLLICVAKTGIFTYLMPTQFLGDMKQLSIYARPESYKGKVAKFYNRSTLSFNEASEIYQLSLN